MSYTLKNIQDKYFLTNTGQNIINYEVKKSDNCVNYNTIYDGTLNSTDDIEITFLGDGEYTLKITDGQTVTEKIIKYYLQLQKLVIEDIKLILCDCGCNNCDECQDCDIFISGKNKIDVYKRLISPQINAFVDLTYSQVKCLIEKQIYCDINNEIYNGDIKYNSKLFKQLIALDYLAIYFFEKNSYCLQEELCYVDNKFKTTEIFCCIEKLDIDINKIENIIEENMGTLTINNAAYINQPPSQVGDNTIGVANRATTTLTMAMFTTATVPAYADPEGDAADAIRINTLPADGVLYLDGVAVIASQVITAVDINNNLLTYESPDQDALDSDNIDFSVRDAGSGQFTT